MEAMEVVCKDCKGVFVLSPEAQTWYQEKLLELPKRCKNCRDRRRNDLRQSMLAREEAGK